MEFSGKNGDESSYRCCYLFGSLELLWLRSWYEIRYQQTNLLDCFVDILGRRSCWAGSLGETLHVPIFHAMILIYPLTPKANTKALVLQGRRIALRKDIQFPAANLPSMMGTSTCLMKSCLGE